MQSNSTKSAFSLVEVIIAVGVFAAGVGSILLLLSSLTRAAGDSVEHHTAQQLTDSLRIELTRVASLEGFDALANSLPEIAATLPAGRQFVATRDGLLLHSLDQLPIQGRIAESEQFFLIECWKYSTEPLRPSGSKAFLATFVRVSWPYRTGTPGGTATIVPRSSRSELTFNCAINR